VGAAAARAAVTKPRDDHPFKANHVSPSIDSPAPVVGRRQIVTHTTTAQPRYTTQDLTPADFLNPQPGDEFFHGDTHAALVAYLARCFRHLYRYSPIVAVLVGAKLIWADPTLAQPAPDITVVANLTDPQRLRDRLDIAAEGARPRFILEVTSPALASLDLAEKVELLRLTQQAGSTAPPTKSGSPQTPHRPALRRTATAHMDCAWSRNAPGARSSPPTTTTTNPPLPPK
jgi:hypothetical protein